MINCLILGKFTFLLMVSGYTLKKMVTYKLNESLL